MRQTKEEFEGTVNTEPLKVEHVCWFTTNRYSHEIDLMEVVKLTYKHPCAPELAYHIQYDIRLVKTVPRTQLEAGTFVVLEAAQNAVTHQVKYSREEYELSSFAKEKEDKERKSI